ncbi:MAG: hypothetical protein CMC86_00070 [Flavobacteriaceae bacterium]|nr:hypothetical protein [Flavobacteriaceae bacterium]
MKLSMSFHKIFLFLIFIANSSLAEEIYKVEVIVLKFNDVITNETFDEDLNFAPDTLNILKEKEILLVPEKFIDNALSSANLLDLNIDQVEISSEGTQEKSSEVISIYEYIDLKDLDFLIGRFKWRDNIEVLDSVSWYQPLKNKNEYTHHYDEVNNISFYINLYKSRYLHLSLKAFNGKLNSDEKIDEFIDENRRIKNSEINYFDHPSLGVIVKVSKT